jgi:hypothetical protein
MNTFVRLRDRPRTRLRIVAEIVTAGIKSWFGVVRTLKCTSEKLSFVQGEVKPADITTFADAPSRNLNVPAYQRLKRQLNAGFLCTATVGDGSFELHLRQSAPSLLPSVRR